MKKTTVLMSVLFIAMSLVACSGKKESNSKTVDNDKSKIAWEKETDAQGNNTYMLKGQKGTYVSSSGEKGKLTYDWIIDDRGISTIVLYEDGKAGDLSTLDGRVRLGVSRQTATEIVGSSIPAEIGTRDSLRNALIVSYDFRTDLAESISFSVDIRCSDIEYDLGSINTYGCEDLFFDSENYKKAIELMDQDLYEEALNILNNIDTLTFDYFECQPKVLECKEKLSTVQTFEQSKKKSI